MALAAVRVSDFPAMATLFLQQAREVERTSVHGHPAVRGLRPLVAGPIPVQLDPVPVWVPQIQGLADPVIARAVERDARSPQAPQRIGQGLSLIHI